MGQKIVIERAKEPPSNWESVIVIPEKATAEPGYITVHTVKDSAHAKHEYHAMAQMAYFQFQDDELEIKELVGPVKLTTSSEEYTLESGMILSRGAEGEFQVFVHGKLNTKKLLETGYRYCTRWVRLDI